MVYYLTIASPYSDETNQTLKHAKRETLLKRNNDEPAGQHRLTKNAPGHFEPLIHHDLVPAKAVETQIHLIVLTQLQYY